MPRESLLMFVVLSLNFVVMTDFFVLEHRQRSFRLPHPTSFARLRRSVG